MYVRLLYLVGLGILLASRNPTIPQHHCSRWKVDAGKRPYSNLDTMIQYLADGPDGLDGKNMTSLNLQSDICQAESRNTFRHVRRTAIHFACIRVCWIPCVCIHQLWTAFRIWQDFGANVCWGSWASCLQVWQMPWPKLMGADVSCKQESAVGLIRAPTEVHQRLRKKTPFKLPGAHFQCCHQCLCQTRVFGILPAFRSDVADLIDARRSSVWKLSPIFYSRSDHGNHSHGSKGAEAHDLLFPGDQLQRGS